MSHPANPATAARLVHAGLLGTPILFFVLAATLPRPLEDATPATTPLLRYGSLGIGAALVAVAALLRNTLPGRAPEQTEDAWWQAHLPRAIMLWAIAEAIGLAGVVKSVVIGDLAGALPLIAASTLLLLHLAPGRLAGRGRGTGQ